MTRSMLMMTPFLSTFWARIAALIWSVSVLRLIPTAYHPGDGSVYDFCRIWRICLRSILAAGRCGSMCGSAYSNSGKFSTAWAPRSSWITLCTTRLMKRTGTRRYVGDLNDSMRRKCVACPPSGSTTTAAARPSSWFSRVRTNIPRVISTGNGLARSGWMKAFVINFGETWWLSSLRMGSSLI